MNWSKVLLAGVVGGVAMNISEFIMHGLILAGTYESYPDVFTQEQANPLWFLLVALCIATAAAILFSKTRQSWADGAGGGATFGFWVGLIVFFPPFYSSLVIDGFPYFLSWCQGGANLVGAVVLGATLGVVIKRA